MVRHRIEQWTTGVREPHVGNWNLETERSWKLEAGGWKLYFAVTCPYCGEESEISVEADVHGTFVQDCEVCCNPWLVRVTLGDDERYVSVGRADGSE